MLECSQSNREQVSNFLPPALKRAISSYLTYTISCDPWKKIDPSSDDDTGICRDSFSDFHKAARVALAHMELLIKLARWAGVEDDVVNQAEMICSYKALDETNDYHQRRETS